MSLIRLETNEVRITWGYSYVLTVVDESGEPQIDTSQIPMVNMPAFEPRRSHYKPNTVRTFFPQSYILLRETFLGSSYVLPFWTLGSQNRMHSYAAMKYRVKDNRKDLTVVELKTFVVVVIFLGLVKYPSVDDAWKGKGAGTWLP